jgi:aspartate aminotransferase
VKYQNIPKLASRLRDVSPSATLSLAQKAREMAAAGHDVVSLTAGEPDFPTAPHVIEAAKRALDRGETRYTAVTGTPELREAIQRRILEDDGIRYELNEIIVSSGAKQSIYNAIQSLLEPGDEAILIAPYWLSYRDMVNLVGGVPVVIETEAERGFLVGAAELESRITPRTRLLVLNSPSNPAGAAYGADPLRAIAELLRRHPEISILSDEIYRRFTYGGEGYASLLRVAPDLQDRVLMVDGCSKTYAMTGFRLGWAAGPRNLISAMGRVQGQTTSNPCSISQAAALAALTGDQSTVAEMVEAFDVRRRFVVGRLRRLPGVRCFDPRGAFYVFPSLAEFVGRRLPDGTEIRDAFTLTAHLLHDHHLVVVPGKPFGAADHLRISFASGMETLTKGLDRLQIALSQVR